MVRNNCCDDTFKPTPTTLNAAYKITNVKNNDWHELLNIRNYKHLHENYHITWVDVTDKNGIISLETQVRVENPMLSKKVQCKFLMKRYHKRSLHSIILHCIIPQTHYFFKATKN